MKEDLQKKIDEGNSLRAEINYADHVVTTCREQLIREFDLWYRSISGNDNRDDNEYYGPIVEKLETFQLISSFLERSNDPAQNAYNAAIRKKFMKNVKKLKN